MRRLAVFALLATTVACAAKAPRTPERLRDEYVQALSDDDAKKAYALLSDDLKKETSLTEFEKRWAANAAQRMALASDGESLPEELEPAVLTGTTAHEGGAVLRWTVVDGRHYVVDGLPGAPTTATPGQTIRALIFAVRTTDLSSIRALLGDELATAIDEDWSSRVEALEAALDRPGSIELSSDLRRAELRYESGRVLTLEQTPRGWRITSLE